MSKPLQVKHLHTDVLIIGGGTAGCYAALTISRNSGLNILVAEKANIKRSGCLAAGVNAINALYCKRPPTTGLRRLRNLKMRQESSETTSF